MTREENAGRLVVYGHDYCALAGVLRDELQSRAIEHDYRDVLAEPQFKARLLALTGGDLSVPTVIFPDGTVWVEPSLDEVLARMGIRRRGLLDRLMERLMGKSRA